LVSSRSQLLQYITGIILIILVSWHLALRIPWLRGVEDFVSTMTPEIVYREISAFGIALLLLAYASLFHGINGLRIILLEIHRGRVWDKLVNIASIVAFIVMAAIATHSVVAVEPPE